MRHTSFLSETIELVDEVQENMGLKPHRGVNSVIVIKIHVGFHGSHLLAYFSLSSNMCTE